jgi:hypothetical protein
MWPITGILMSAVIIFIIDGRLLWRKKLKKELWVFCILLLTGTGLSVAQSLNVKIPNPIEAIVFLFLPVTKAIVKFLE